MPTRKSILKTQQLNPPRRSPRLHCPHNAAKSQGRKPNTDQVPPILPTRKSVPTTQQLNPLRRSPRLHSPPNTTEPAGSNLHKPKPGNNLAHSPDLSPGSMPNPLVEKIVEAHADEVSKKTRKPRRYSMNFPNSTPGFRRSPRLNAVVDSSRRRSLRLCNQRNEDRFVENLGVDKSKKVIEHYLSESIAKSCKDKHKGVSKNGEKGAGFISIEEMVFENKRKKGRQVGTMDEKANSKVVSNSDENEAISEEVNEEKCEAAANLSEPDEGTIKKSICLGLRALKAQEREQMMRDVCQGSENIRIGGMRKRSEEGNGVIQEWTKEQEAALERAYFSAKPTPNFWKKVAKLVPGKSAQECFDKVHSDLATPPQNQVRSRANKIRKLSIEPFSLSASKLLQSSERKIKKSRSNKLKSCLVHKTARRLLEKHYQVLRNNEADLFSVLEPDASPSMHALPNVVLSTPRRLQGKQGSNQKCYEKSAGLEKPPPSTRFCKTALVSPQVLKPVKNKVLHEKYIDKLHCREAKRREEYARKSASGKENRNSINVQHTNMITAAKDALVSNARDAIDHFRNLQAKTVDNSLDLDDDGEVKSGDDETDIEL